MRAWIEPAEERRARDAGTLAAPMLVEAVAQLASLFRTAPNQTVREQIFAPLTRVFEAAQELGFLHPVGQIYSNDLDELANDPELSWSPRETWLGSIHNTALLVGLGRG